MVLLMEVTELPMFPPEDKGSALYLYIQLFLVTESPKCVIEENPALV